MDGTLLGFVVDGIISGDPGRIAGIFAAFILAAMVLLVCWAIVSPASEENQLEWHDVTDQIYKLQHAQPRKCSRKRKQ